MYGIWTLSFQHSTADKRLIISHIVLSEKILTDFKYYVINSQYFTIGQLRLQNRP